MSISTSRRWKTKNASAALAAGSIAGTGVTLSDGHRPAAIQVIHDDGDEAGEITCERVADDELSGHFEAALGTLTDELRGCLHVDVMSADVEP